MATVLRCRTGVLLGVAQIELCIGKQSIIWYNIIYSALLVHIWENTNHMNEVFYFLLWTVRSWNSEFDRAKHAMRYLHVILHKKNISSLVIGNDNNITSCVVFRNSKWLDIAFDKSLFTAIQIGSKLMLLIRFFTHHISIWFGISPFVNSAIFCLAIPFSLTRRRSTWARLMVVWYCCWSGRLDPEIKPIVVFVLKCMFLWWMRHRISFTMLFDDMWCCFFVLHFLHWCWIHACLLYYWADRRESKHGWLLQGRKAYSHRTVLRIFQT